MHLNVLCVEDDADIRVILDVALSMDRHMTVTHAVDGHAALRFLAGGGASTDVVLLDIRLPGIDGRLLVGEIRCIPGCGEVPIIFVTSLAAGEAQALAEKMGAIGVITKPFDPTSIASDGLAW